MIKIKVIGSSSKGNCYLLSTNTTNILLDCGVKNMPKVFNYSNIDGILLTHQHIDHVGGIPNVKNYYKGKYYGNKDVMDILPILDYFKVEVNEGKKFEIKDLIIIPFSLVHDVPIFGYLIKDKVS